MRKIIVNSYPVSHTLDGVLDAMLVTYCRETTWEINDAITRYKVSMALSNLLHSTPKVMRYGVWCNASNNHQYVIDNHDLVVAFEIAWYDGSYVHGGMDKMGMHIAQRMRAS